MIEWYLAAWASQLRTKLAWEAKVSMRFMITTPPMMMATTKREMRWKNFMPKPTMKKAMTKPMIEMVVAPALLVT